MWAKPKGFTIVELLVVIVVIGILAGISTVAYNGAQQRARDTKRIHDVEAIVNALTSMGIKTNIQFNNSGAGFGNATIGFINTKNDPANGHPNSNYPNQSILEWLTNNGYLGDGVSEPNFSYEVRDYAVTLCQDTDGSKNKRVVMARLEVVPTKTISQQLPVGNGCTGFWYSVFQGAPFYMNYAQMVDVQ